MRLRLNTAPFAGECIASTALALPMSQLPAPYRGALARESVLAGRAFLHKVTALAASMPLTRRHSRSRPLPQRGALAYRQPFAPTEPRNRSTNGKATPPRGSGLDREASNRPANTHNHWSEPKTQPIASLDTAQPHSRSRPLPQRSALAYRQSFTSTEPRNCLTNGKATPSRGSGLDREASNRPADTHEHWPEPKTKPDSSPDTAQPHSRSRPLPQSGANAPLDAAPLQPNRFSIPLSQNAAPLPQRPAQGGRRSSLQESLQPCA